LKYELIGFIGGGSSTALEVVCECLLLDGVRGRMMGILVMGFISPLATARATSGSTKAPMKGISSAVRVPSRSVR
jgi:hypothetical protein